MVVGTNFETRFSGSAAAYFCADLCCAADREGEDVLFGHYCCDGGWFDLSSTTANKFVYLGDDSVVCEVLRQQLYRSHTIQEQRTHRHLHLFLRIS